MKGSKVIIISTSDIFFLFFFSFFPLLFVRSFVYLLFLKIPYIPFLAYYHNNKEPMYSSISLLQIYDSFLSVCRVYIGGGKIVSFIEVTAPFQSGTNSHSQKFAHSHILTDPVKLNRTHPPFSSELLLQLLIPLDESILSWICNCTTGIISVIGYLLQPGLVVLSAALSFLKVGVFLFFFYGRSSENLTLTNFNLMTRNSDSKASNSELFKAYNSAQYSA